MKIFNKILVLLLAIGFTACGENTSVSYDGPSLVEFPLAETTVDEGAGATTIRTQLVGPHEATDLNVTFEVDEASTAVAGTHYTLTTNGSFTIPANSSFGDIELTIADGTLASDESVTLIINLTGGDLIPSENYKTHTLTIDGQ